MTPRPLPTEIPVPPAVSSIVETLEAAGFEAWCVGGALRDAVLGLVHADFDVATSATPDRVRKLFRRTVAVGEKYGTVGVLDDAGVLHEVTTFRQDVRTDGRHAEVAFGVSLEEDLARRDFTINAIAWHPLRRQWSDPFGGASDLGARRVRAVGDPAARFREDYLRVLRALRFAARLEFAIEPATWTALRDAVAGLEHLSAERVRDEWFKSLRTAARVSLLVSLWQESGVAAVLVPELLATAGREPELSRPPRDPVLLTTVLTDNPEAVLRRWRASNAELARARAITAGPARPAEEGLAGVRRWLSSTGEVADDLLRRHQLAHGSVAPWARDVDTVRERGDPLSREALAVRGGDLLAMGLSGPAVGRMLDQLLERVLETPSLNSRDTLLELARTLA